DLVIIHSFPTRRSSDLIDNYYDYLQLEEGEYEEILTNSESWYSSALKSNPQWNKPFFDVATRQYILKYTVPLKIGEGNQNNAIRSEEHTSELQSRENLV